MTATPVLPLSPLEARVLGVLVEKQHTVPDTYPLSLNALVAGCNQKTSRDPVMDASDADVLAALEGLRERVLAIESSGGRVMRYSENAKRVLGIPSESVALLATLVLRGPQTAAELRANCDRLHRFSDLSATEGYLEELAARAPQPYVRLLPRQPGARESRWTHLLCGAPSPVETIDPPRGTLRPVEPTAGSGAEPTADAATERTMVELTVVELTVVEIKAELVSLRARTERLEAEVAALREALGQR